MTSAEDRGPASDRVVGVTEGVGTILHDRQSDATVVFDPPAGGPDALRKYGLTRADVDELWLLDREFDRGDLAALCDQPSDRDDPLSVVAPRGDDPWTGDDPALETVTRVDDPWTDGDPALETVLRAAEAEDTPVEVVTKDVASQPSEHTVGDLQVAYLGKFSGEHETTAVASVSTTDRPFRMVLRGDTPLHERRSAAVDERAHGKAGGMTIRAAYRTIRGVDPEDDEPVDREVEKIREAYQIVHDVDPKEDELVYRVPGLADSGFWDAFEPETAYRPIPSDRHTEGMSEDEQMRRWRQSRMAYRDADNVCLKPFATADTRIESADRLDRAEVRLAVADEEAARIVDALDDPGNEPENPDAGTPGWDV